MATVRHGSDVEVRGDAFVEGAWDGELETMAFDEAIALAGSGGRLLGDSIVFSSPFHPLECLYTLAGEDELLVSNSLAFLLVEAGDGPDIGYTDYFFDLLRHGRRGIPNLRVGLPTARGGAVRPFQVCNLRVGADLQPVELPKAVPPSPADYEDCRAMLARAAERVARNATADGRKAKYRLVAAVSRGYDSTASAAITAQAGGREAVTFIRSANRRGVLVDDCGSEIAGRLGLRATEYDREDLGRLTGFPEAEMFANPGNLSQLALRLMERRLEGALFVSGRHGEDYWGIDKTCARRGLREIESVGLAGRGATELRLRVGYLHFPVLYVGAVHGVSINRVSRSEAMRRWALRGKGYDRPILRRIAEEAGAPRESFGRAKAGGSGPAFRDLRPASEEDFLDFCRSAVPPAVLARLDSRRQQERDRRHYRAGAVRKLLASRPSLHPLLDALPLDRWHAMWRSIHLYRFHWGFERIRERYSA